MVGQHAVYPNVRVSAEAVRLPHHALTCLLAGLWLLTLFGHCAIAADPEAFGKPLELGGSLELVYEQLRNGAFGQQIGDDVRTSKQEIQLQLSYRASERLSALGEIKWRAEQQTYANETSRLSETEGDRGETWLYWQRPFDSNASIKIGRQNFAEPRQWWWDEDLDALRFDYIGHSWHLMLGIAEALARKTSREKFIDPQDDQVLRLLAHAGWRLSSSLQFSLFYLHQNDHSKQPSLDSLVETRRIDDSDADLRWAGLRVSGDINPSQHTILRYWLDNAAVSGNEVVFEYGNETAGMSPVTARRQQRVRGHAVDMGLIWSPTPALGPTLALSHARGSGDKNLNDDTDRAFRQTGLQDPTQEFRYYGELLRPELSNLSITTATIGFGVTPKSRLTLGYHQFRQVHPAAFLRDARIDLRPTGQDTDLGREISLLVEIREWQDLKVVLAAASFQAGRAFGPAAGERANSVFLEFTYEF